MKNVADCQGEGAGKGNVAETKVRKSGNKRVRGREPVRNPAETRQKPVRNPAEPAENRVRKPGRKPERVEKNQSRSS